MEKLMLFLLLLGLLMMLLIIFLGWSETWPTASGTLRSATVATIGVNSRTFYRPNISYCYDVFGAEYCSRNLTLLGGRPYQQESLAEAMVRALPRSSLPVYYCPAWPRLCYLHRNRRLMFGLIPLVVVSFALPLAFFNVVL